MRCKMKNAVKLFSIVLVFSFVNLSCAKKQNVAVDTITIGMTADLDSMDPARAESASTREILFNVYEGLVKPDTKGNLNFALAENVSISSDGKTYTFTLRNGVKFHNGNNVTCEDVKFSLERYSQAKTGGSLVSAFKALEKVSVLDDKTVQVVLKKGNTDFLAYFTIGITPASVQDLDATPVGTGPYKYVSRSPLENVVFEKFNDYWDEGGKAHIQNVVYKLTSNTDTIGMELAGGALDLFYRLPESQISQLPEKDFTVYEGTMNLVQALYLNNRKAPFNDVRVRKALSYACDKKEIMNFVSGGKGAALSSSMYPSFGKYYMEELNEVYKTDLEKAKALLAEAGYPNGFSFTLHVSSAHPQHVETSQVLAEQFAKIGVTVSIQEIEWNSWVSNVYVGRDFESTVVGLDASALTAPALLARFVSTDGKNFIGFNSARYDDTYAKATASVDDAEKTKLYKGCEAILTNEAASVYIQDLPSFVALNKKFTGYEFYPLYAQNIAHIKPTK